MSQVRDHQVRLSEGKFLHSPQRIGEKLLVFNLKKGTRYFNVYCLNHIIHRALKMKKNSTIITNNVRVEIH